MHNYPPRLDQGGGEAAVGQIRSEGYGDNPAPYIVGVAHQGLAGHDDDVHEGCDEGPALRQLAPTMRATARALSHPAPPSQ